MPHDVITQLLRVLAIETKQEKAIINADPPDVALSGLEAFSFDYIVKWPLSLIINRFRVLGTRAKRLNVWDCRCLPLLLSNTRF